MGPERRPRRSLVGSRPSRRDFLKALAALALSPSVGLARQDTQAPPRPNILLVLADDLGQECLSAYGGTSYSTPNLDRLAASGMLFRHCFATPMCGPSRIELLTGRYIRGFREWGELDVDREITFGRVLRDAGYATAVAGKWQLCRFDDPRNADHPQRGGFQESSLWTWVLNEPQGPRTPSKYWSPLVWQNGALASGLEGRYGPDVYADFLVEFIRRREEPFLAFYPMVLPHGPFTPTPHSGLAARLLGYAPQRMRGRLSSVYFPEHVEYMDHLVGRLVAALEEQNMLEQTLILFTADNGTDRRVESRVGDREVRGGKGRLSEPGTRVPLIASWKGHIQPGSVCEDLVDLSDFFPTLAAVARAPLPAGLRLDGRSFLPQLLGEPGDPREWVYNSNWVYPDGPFQVVARGPRFKLYGDGRLYDLAQDPEEWLPLSPATESPEAARARRKLAAVLRHVAEGGP
jgi:arylsulfatase A